MRLTKFSYGSLSHHIRMLEKEGSIIVERGKVTRLYSRSIRESDRRILSNLRSKVRRDVIGILMDGEKSLEEISSKIKKSRSTLRWHLNHLISDGLVSKRIDREAYYSLNEKEYIARISRRYNLPIDEV